MLGICQVLFLVTLLSCQNDRELVCGYYIEKNDIGGEQKEIKVETKIGGLEKELDITLPDGNGFNICKFVKERKDIPIIFLTARDEETNVVMGLDLGADDYIIKPFRTRELISRINSVFRRYNKADINSNIIKYKDIKIDMNQAKVYKGEQEIIFTSLEYRIVLMLFSNVNKLITRDELLEKIWDVAGNFVNDNTLTVYIKRIREKLEDENIIKTVRGLGYRVGD